MQMQYGKTLTDVTHLNFFEVARAALSSRNISPRQEVRCSARQTSPLTMVKVKLCFAMMLALSVLYITIKQSVCNLTLIPNVNP